VNNSKIIVSVTELAIKIYSAGFKASKSLIQLLVNKHSMADATSCQKEHDQCRRDYSNVPLQNIKVACVMDEFTYHSYAPECNLFQLTPANVLEELRIFQPDLLFIESAWRGKNELWNRKIGGLSKELKSALLWCKGKNIPTVFWNKEDPVHFETFLTTAKQFDYVFTTDIDCIGRYKAALGHKRVFLLPFACQPKTHNPVEIYNRKEAFCFAGAYYVRYPERTRDLSNYVAELPKFKPLEIFDRNFGKDDINYQFSPEYQPYIVGTLPFNEIDKAYKGYRYSINLNSIKQSQSMFARRVYELLASNTITVSNFSRGVRLLFGDLLVTSDSGKDIVERLQRLGDEDEQKLRLAGLRKVMLEHTYEHRLAYVLSKALRRRIDAALPTMLVVAMAQTSDQCRAIIENFRRQSYADKRLLLVTAPGISAEQAKVLQGEAITIVNSTAQANALFTTLVSNISWLVPMVPTDYYGPNYLLDLAIATRYGGTDLVGKRAYYQFADDALELIDAERAYRPAKDLAMRSSAVRVAALPNALRTDLSWLSQMASENWGLPGLSIDPFNYIRNGVLAADAQAVVSRVNDLDIDVGISCDHLIQIAEDIAPVESHATDHPRWSSARLKQLVSATHAQVNIQEIDNGLCITSSLPDETHHYLYSTVELPIASLPSISELKTHLDAAPGLDVQYVFIFLDEEKRKISNAILIANRNHTVAVPDGTALVRFGWRVTGNGRSIVKHLQWGHSLLEPEHVIGRSQHLVLTNHYPTYDDLYRNAFLHTRVLAYAEQGVKVDVFRLRKEKTISYHEYQNVDVMTGSREALHRLLNSGRYKTVLVHFLDQAMWEVLRHHIDCVRVVVWVHGADIQPWYRRDFNFLTEKERSVARTQSDARMAFWRQLLQQMPVNLKLVFVSHYFAEEVMEDLGFRLPEDKYQIIHNPIDTDLFYYSPKSAEQRKKILSIRPYASRVYANDLSVATILELSKKPFFPELEFRMIGDGVLFETVLEPLRKFPNVIIERRFLARNEIAKLHKEYGVFLCPSRMDTQGVSRDEAMASGLVPITNSVAAIPEFVDEDSGILSAADDFKMMVNGIAEMIESPDLFIRKSISAAARVRRQSSKNIVISLEIDIIRTV
jgi:spore maturation protein CgeB/glycosyltransferase involved in cell wall biosynthesis